MPSTALVIFVKTPGHSPVKTRLAASISSSAATDLYLRSVKALEETAELANRAEPSIHPLWAVAEQDALENSLWSRFERISQGAGDLGDRLSSVHQRIAHRFRSWIFIGADSPQLPPSVLTRTAALLGNPDPLIVIGPALDGGFYLFGSNLALDEGIWRDIEYSTETTLAQLLARLPKNIPITMLPLESDLDTIQDLWAIRKSLWKTTLITSSQRELFDAISAHTRVKKGILFLCVANSARSQMAHGIARQLLSTEIQVESAGSAPTHVNPLAIQAMKEIGIDISSHHSKAFNQVNLHSFDLVITLCEPQVCPTPPEGVLVIHIPHAEPGATIEQFRAIRDVLRDTIAEILTPSLQGQLASMSSINRTAMQDS